VNWIAVVEQPNRRAVRVDADQAVREDAGDPQATLDIERQAVGKFTGPELRDEFPLRQRTIVGQAKPRQATCIRLVDIQPLPGGIDPALVGKAQPVSDDARTTIFDYWSMPAMAGWVNDHKYDGGKLSGEQKALREFYGRLVRLSGEPAFRDGALYSLNPANKENTRFGRIGDESVSGHWCYAFLRSDAATKQRFLVIANLHPRDAVRDLRVIFPPEALRSLALDDAPKKLQFRDRLAPEPVTFVATIGDLSATGLEIAEIPPLSARYLEFSPNDPGPPAAASPDIPKSIRD